MRSRGRSRRRSRRGSRRRSGGRSGRRRAPPSYREARGASPGESTSCNVPLRSSLAFVALRGCRPRRDQRFEGWSAGARPARARASRLVPGVEAAASGAHDRRAARVGPRLRRASPAPWRRPWGRARARRLGRGVQRGAGPRRTQKEARPSPGPGAAKRGPFRRPPGVSAVASGRCPSPKPRRPADLAGKRLGEVRRLWWWRRWQGRTRTDRW